MIYICIVFIFKLLSKSGHVGKACRVSDSRITIHDTYPLHSKKRRKTNKRGDTERTRERNAEQQIEKERESQRLRNKGRHRGHLWWRFLGDED